MLPTRPGKSTRRKTRQTYPAEEKIRIVFVGYMVQNYLGAVSPGRYHSWSKVFLEAGKRRLSGDTARQTTSPEVKELHSETLASEKCPADLTLEKRLLKKA